MLIILLAIGLMFSSVGLVYLTEKQREGRRINVFDIALVLFINLPLIGFILI